MLKTARHGHAAWCSIFVNVGVVPGRCGEKGAELEGQALYLAVNLCSNPHNWPRALGSDRKNENRGYK